MKRISWTLGVLVAASVATAVAQPPGGRGGPGGGPRGGRPPMPVIEVLDADHDHVISADELKNATASLLTLDKNNDGRLTENEFGPEGGRPGAGRGQGGPPGGGRSADGPTRRGPPGGQGGPGGRGRGGGPGNGPDQGPPPPPSPERMVEHAMEFDADNDGKLSPDELKKFAEEIGRHHGGPPPRRGDGPDDGGPNDNEAPQRPRRPD